jgi:hypothetical protein
MKYSEHHFKLGGICIDIHMLFVSTFPGSCRQHTGIKSSFWQKTANSDRKYASYFAISMKYENMSTITHLCEDIYIYCLYLFSKKT